MCSGDGAQFGAACVVGLCVSVCVLHVAQMILSLWLNTLIISLVEYSHHQLVCWSATLLGKGLYEAPFSANSIIMRFMTVLPHTCRSHCVTDRSGRQSRFNFRPCTRARCRRASTSSSGSCCSSSRRPRCTTHLYTAPGARSLSRSGVILRFG